MKVLYPSRITERHVGGNTTYARRLMRGLQDRGVLTGLIPSARHPIMTALLETGAGQRRAPGTVLHYSADTGSLIPTRAASVLTVHGVASRWVDGIRTARQESAWRFRVQRAIKSSSQLITVSHSAANDIAEVFAFDRDRIHVIHHGIDPIDQSSGLRPSPTIANLLPAKFVLYLGNLEPRKNLRSLIRAFESNQMRGAGVSLLIAGRPAWNFEGILSDIESATNTVYLGFVEDADRAYLMRNAELFVFPSLYEGFGFPVLEAMAYGTPVAASRRGSLAEVAGPSWHLEDLEAEGLANSISLALTDSQWRSRAREEGPKWVRQFQWDVSIERHIKVYREAAQE